MSPRDLPRKTDPTVDFGPPAAAASAVRPPVDSSTDLTLEKRSQRAVVALALQDPVLDGKVRAELLTANIAVGGADDVRTASVVLVDGGDDAPASVARARAVARADAAVIVVFGDAPAADVAAARTAGAFACISPVAGELAGGIRIAVEAAEAKVQIADLTKQLD